MRQTNPVADFQAGLADALREYVAEPGAARSDILKRAAAICVELRALHVERRTGREDWSGRSWAYRQAIGEAFDAAGISVTRDRTTIGNALRHHVSVALRERVEPDELAAHGLRDVDSKGRSIEQKARRLANTERRAYLAALADVLAVLDAGGEEAARAWIAQQ